MKRALTAAALTAALAACGQPVPPAAPNPPAANTPPTAIGLVEVRLAGVSRAHPTATATLVAPGRVKPQDAMSAVAGALSFGTPASATVTDNTNSLRYAKVTIPFTNVSGADLTNITFIAVDASDASLPASYQTIAGTAVHDWLNVDGGTADTSLLTSLVPTHGVQLNGVTPTVVYDPNNGLDETSLQLYDESDLYDGTGTPTITDLTTGAKPFPYGFVSRCDTARTGNTCTSSAPRTIPNGSSDGTVTIAVRVPLAASNNAETFSMMFQIVTDPVTRVTEGANEQSADGEAAARATAVNAAQVTVLSGSTYAGSTSSRTLCSVRTAGAYGAATGTLKGSNLSLAVGATSIVYGAAAAHLCVTDASSGSEYVVVPVYSTGTAASSSTQVVTTTATGITSVSGPPTPNVGELSLNAGGLNATAASATLTPDLEWETALRERDRRELNPLLAAGATRGITRLNGRTAQLTRSGGSIRPMTIPSGVTPVVGDVMELNVADGCSGTADIRHGKVKAVSAHAAVVEETYYDSSTSTWDDTQPAIAGGLTDTDYAGIATEFENLVWPAVTTAFGEPTDVDANGHVVIFYTTHVNQLSPAASSSVVLGYFTSRDLFSTVSCNLSNEGEMFYMLMADPSGTINSNVRTVSYVQGNTVGTIAHEFQHLINAWRRAYVTGASNFEESWLNEGLSHIAEELMFYKATAAGMTYPTAKTCTTGGLAPRQNIILSNLTSGTDASCRVQAFNTYENQNYSRLKEFLQLKSMTSPTSNGDSPYGPDANQLALRGAIWAFLRYAADRVNGDESTFWATLEGSNLEGLANLQNAIGTDPIPWFRDWSAAMYADDVVTGIDSTLKNASWNYRSVYGGLGGFPLSRDLLSSGVGVSKTLRSGGTRYLRFGLTAGSTATLAVTNTGTPLTGTVSVTVLRTK